LSSQSMAEVLVMYYESTVCAFYRKLYDMYRSKNLSFS
jgi:hypothetical protein